MQAQASPYHALRVSAMIDETHDAKSIVFAAPANASAFAYRPGQFLTLRIPVAGAQVVRCYSLASAPALGDAMKITVKRVDGGLASNWICDELGAGDEVQVLPPVGVFTPKQIDGDFLLFAGGSGVTPIMSILKSALHQGRGKVVLIYANRDERSVIFADELNDIARQYPQRLSVYHWLETVQGRPGLQQLAALAQPYTKHEAFICGPGPFMDCAAAALAELGVPRQRVHVERFVSLSNDPGEVSVAVAPAAPVEPGSELSVELDGEVRILDWQRERTLLDTLLAAKLAAPYSCREGKCSACICKVVQGKVSMQRNAVLTAEDLAEGYVLACQALPETSSVHVSFD
jgi:3-ketosteroid 9alpha-monooxygenase subunit B